MKNINLNGTKMEQNNQELDIIAGLGNALREGKVYIKYSKKDGTITERLATLKDDIIAQYIPPKPLDTLSENTQAPTRKVNPTVMPYFELGEKPGFKSFIKANLVSYRIYVENETKKV